MSVARSGSVVTWQNAANSGTQAVTVPSGVSLAVLGVRGFNSDTAFLQTPDAAPTLGGTAMTQKRFDVDTGDGNQTVLYTLVNPTSGAQNLVWNWKGATAWGDGGDYYLAFYTGSDTTTPVGSVGGAGVQNGANTATASSGALTVATGDMIVAVAYGFDNGPQVAGDMTWTNLTAAVGPAISNGSIGSYAEASPAAGSVTGSCTVAHGSSVCYVTASYIVIKAAAAAAHSLAVPGSRDLHRLPHLIGR